MRQGLAAGAAEAVGHDVLLAGDVRGEDGEVVLGGQLVEGAQDGQHRTTARGLPVDDGNVALVVEAEQDGRVSKQRSVRSDSVQRGHGLEKADAAVRAEPAVRWGPSAGKGGWPAANIP